MGVFGRGRAGEAEPIDAVARGRVAAAHVLEGVLTLKIVTPAGEALIEVPAKALPTAGGRELAETAPGFAGAVAELVGAKVRGAWLRRGHAIHLDFGKAGTLAI